MDPSITNPGPIDGSVLYDQDKHVSAAVWEGQERGALRCHEHTSKLGEWRLLPEQIELVNKAGFGHLRKIPAIICERLLGKVPDSNYASGGMCWSYYHLNIGRPKLNRDPIHDQFPFVLKWKGKQSGPSANRDVVFYRKALDTLQPSDVEWLPYKFVDCNVIPEEVKSTLILGRSKTMLICFDKAERHLPDRCLRQYGMLQWIPEDVPRWVRKSRGVDGGVDLSGKMEAELTEWADRRLHIVDGEDGVDESEYMEWYWRITRKIVGRPISLSYEFQRTLSGLREVAYLAETFSTKGLDAHQYESISRIRCIVQECLRDQVGVSVAELPSPESETIKRVRGKERVRRKGAGKRKRTHDALDGYAVSEDDHSQFCGPLVDVDQSHGMVGNLPLYVEEDHMGLHNVTHKIDDTDMCDVNEGVHASELCNASDEVEHTHISQFAIESDPQTAKPELESSQPYDAPTGMDDTQHCEADDSQLSHFVDDDDPRSSNLEETDLSQPSEIAEEVEHPADEGILLVAQSSPGIVEEYAQQGENGILITQSSLATAENVKQLGDECVVTESTIETTDDNGAPQDDETGA
ncbi:hypothetical protein ACFE04_031077 [Oxalis oulophora]